jgi:hypothetical protein
MAYLAAASASLARTDRPRLGKGLNVLRREGLRRRIFVRAALEGGDLDTPIQSIANTQDELVHRRDFIAVRIHCGAMRQWFLGEEDTQGGHEMCDIDRPVPVAVSNALSTDVPEWGLPQLAASLKTLRAEEEVAAGRNQLDGLR